MRVVAAFWRCSCADFRAASTDAALELFFRAASTDAALELFFRAASPDAALVFVEWL
jgi:hypothetical protein